MLPVYFEDQIVGTISVDESAPRFAYDEAWVQRRNAFPISVTMPLTKTDVPEGLFQIWAANLLPEAEQLTIVGRQLGVSTNDIVALLETIGRDTAGALSFGAPGGKHKSDWHPVKNDADLERIIDELPRKPFLVGDDGVSMSLAGVQSKIAIAKGGAGDFYIPLNGSPSTHILKPDSDRLPGSVQNEAFCLSLARRCGLQVPEVSTGVVGKRSYLLIDRYDRKQEGEVWGRLHQEDFCQILGKPPAAKYQGAKSGIAGPTLAQMINATRQHGLAQDVLAMLDHAIFNILACNTDAHAKNYAMFVTSGRARMAPLYDVMCARVYDGITRNLAQKIDNQNRGEHIAQRHWLRFARDAGLGKAVLRRISTLANRVISQTETARQDVEAMAAGGHYMLAQICEAVAARGRAILAGLEDDRTNDPLA